MNDPHSSEASKPAAAVQLHPELASYVTSVIADLSEIPEERRQRLDELAAFVRDGIASGAGAKLTFICTHNSRRSHMSQLWAAAAAGYYGLKNVETYSGGTEATAFNPRAVSAMQRAGFEVQAGPGDNPHYQVTYAPDAPAQECFSKKYDDDFNPKEGFVAVMTCSQADRSCPMVYGAAHRVSIPYVDPKVSDGTAEEAATYDARARQIATEMFYLFSRVGA